MSLLVGQDLIHLPLVLLAELRTYEPPPLGPPDHQLATLLGSKARIDALSIRTPDPRTAY